MYCILPTVRSMKIKFLTGTIILLIVYIFLFYLMIQIWMGRRSLPVMKSPVVLPHVVVHIDLKGAPPKLAYLESLLPMLKEHGVSGLLMEYEDMFPYEGKLVNISSKNCYGKTELKRFLGKAAKSDIEIIPLVQTFGHMEHVLKLEVFRHLREAQAYPDSICPSKIESRALIRHMLKQVIDFHSSAAPLDYIHVGCDEVFHINKCAQCAARKTSNVDVFTEYVTFITNYINTRSPLTTVLIWDDMLRSVKLLEWNTITLPKKVELVYWDYEPTLHVSHVNLLKYHKGDRGIWIASAFKGADGRDKTLPNVQKRFLNHFNWMSFIKDYQFGGERDTHNFKGIILTGWSRYSHMDPLCELLPAAIPSLILNLLTVQQFRTVTGYVMENADDLFRHVYEEFHRLYQCHGHKTIRSAEYLNCDFESSPFFDVLMQYEVLRSQMGKAFGEFLFSIEYQASKRYMNTNLVPEHITWCNNTLNELVYFRIMLSNYMKRYFNMNVIDEYVSYKTYAPREKIESILKSLISFSETRVWDRNPLNMTT